MVIPTTVPHSGRESFEGTAPLCEDGAEAPRRTTATFPRNTGLQCRWSAARFRRRLDGGLRDRTLRHHTVDDEPPYGNQEFTCERHHHDLANAAASRADALTEPG